MKKIEQEGDYFEFEYCGFKCEVKRIPDLKHLCGYVHLKDGIVLDIKPYEYDSLNIECHGGITYNEDNVLGFDTAHLGDFSPHHLYEP